MQTNSAIPQTTLLVSKNALTSRCFLKTKLAHFHKEKSPILSSENKIFILLFFSNNKLINPLSQDNAI